MKKPKEGLAFFKNLPDDEDGELTKLGGTTLAYAAINDTANAEKGIAKLSAAMQTDSMGRALNFLILIHTIMGNHEKALDLIEQCIANRMPLTLLLYTEPFLKPLRSNIRFRELMKKTLGERTNFGVSKRKYKKSLLNDELLKQYQAHLEKLMSEEKPYLDPGLTLRGLAEILDIPANHLSQLLNEGFDKNFAEYVNSYRVETFKTKAADPGHQHLTLLAIAYASGFNSKTVFNTFFKKMEGKTPKAYWREVVK